MTELGPFRLQKRVARGGMAVVWRAVHVEHGLPVAIKVMSEQLARSRRHRRAFFDEVRAVASLDHPKVVSVLDFGEVSESAADPIGGPIEGSPWLAMEWVRGRTLADAALWSWGRLRTVALDVLDALAHAHARGVIHRDLKPANVMFAMDDDTVRVKLTDFGIARHSDAADEDEGARVRGTPNYMAPEQILGSTRDQGPWTDLYALGCVLWRIVTGGAPFQRRDQQRTLKAHLVDPLPDFDPVIAVPDGLVEFLHHLLARTPTRRFQFAADAAVALGALPDAEEAGEFVGDAFAETIVDGPTISVPVETLDLEAADTGDAPRIAFAAVPEDWRRPTVELPDRDVVRAGLNLFGLRQTPFVDRDETRTLLWDVLRQVADRGGPRTVVLEGPLGSGKTRLARWLTERAHEIGAARSMWAHHSEEFGDSDGIGPLVARAFRFDGMPRHEAEQRVAQGLFGTEELTDDRRLDVQSVLRLAFGGRGFSLNPSDRQRAFVRMLTAVTRRRPVIVVFDDIQWGWEAVELACALMESELDVMTVVTARTEALRGMPTRQRLDGLLAAEGVVRVSVEALAANHSQVLVREALPLEPGLVHQVADWGGGNPLWTTQLLGDLVDQGKLTLRDDGFGLRSGEEIDPPEDALQVFQRRFEGVLRSIEEEAETALRVAGVIGAEVVREEWGAACRRVGVEPLEPLEHELLRRALAEGTAEGFVFAHPLAVEAIRRRIPDDQRPELHRACLDVLDEVEGRQRMADWERRARHRLALAEPIEAIEAMLSALDCAHGEAVPSRVRALLDQTASLVRRHSPPPATRAALWLHESRLAVNADIDACEMWAEKVLQLDGTRRQQRLRARALVATAARLRGDGETAAEQFGVLIEELDPESELMARALTDYGLALKWLGRLGEASAAFRRGTELFGALGHVYYQGRCVRYEGDIAFQRGRLDVAERLWNTARELAIDAGDRVSVAACTNLAGELYRARGDFAEAAESYTSAVELFRGAGHWGHLIAGFNRALAWFADGDVERASEEFTRVRRGMVDQSLDSGILTCDLGLVACAARSGDWNDVASGFDRAADAIRDTNLVDRDVTDICRWIFEDAEAAGRSDIAEVAVDLAVEQFEALGLAEEADRSREWRGQDAFDPTSTG